MGIVWQGTGARGALRILSLIESESMLSYHGVHEAFYRLRLDERHGQEDAIKIALLVDKEKN